MNIQQANYQDLRRAYYDTTLAKPSANALLNAIYREDDRWLSEMLRHHSEWAVSKSSEIEQRDGTDDFLVYCGVLETAVTAGFIAQPDGTGFWVEARRLLENRHLQRYYCEHYPLKLPQLLLRRLQGLQAATEEPRASVKMLFMEFLALDRRFIQNHRDRGLLKMLDDFTLRGQRFSDVVEVIGRQEEFIERILRSAEEREYLDTILEEFSLFMQFCFDLHDILHRMRSHSLLQSEIWNHYSYWFGIIGQQLERQLGDALRQFLDWTPVGGTQEHAEAVQTYVQQATVIIRDLVSTSYATAVDCLLNGQGTSTGILAKQPDSRPQFVDNRDGNTLDAALREYLRALREGQQAGNVDVATAYFNLPGFDLLADEFGKVARLRLLLGAEPRPEPQWPDPQPGESRDDAFTRRLVDEGLRELDAALLRGRDLLPFDLETDASIRRLLALLRGGKFEVRRYTKHFLHAKAFLFRKPGGGLVTGSSNLTYAGLRKNVELNLGHFDTPAVPRVEAWFDELWSEAAPFDLAAIYDRLTAEFPPYLIYLRVLYALYGEELAQEQQEKGEIPLTTFQEHGVWRALRILQKCGGVLVADGVGLGKTFLAGAIIGQYRSRRQRVLLICPAALRDSTWREFLHRFQMFVECVSYEELANDAQLGGAHKHLHGSLEEFALVVIDEAHNYRNPDSPARAQVLRRLLMGPRRDLLLLTATPVNNSLWDLYHLLRYFVKQDALFADRGVLSLRERFTDAMKEDPFNLNPDVLYPVIDATTVKRTRQFIKKHYTNDLITLPSGERVPIHFPEPVASTINYDLEAVLLGFFEELAEKLIPDGGNVVLTLARYQPENYPAGAEEIATDTAIVGLLRSGLLKRFESSVHAFAETTRMMVREHDLFLQGLDAGKVIRKELMQELSAAEDDDEMFEDLLASSEHAEPASLFNVAALRRDVEADRALLDKWHKRAAKVKPEQDPKLAALVEELVRIAKQAKDEATSDGDECQRRKVLLFSFYADTIDWIESFLDRALEHDKRLAAFSGRMASVAGNESRRGVSRREAVWGFAPKSAGAPKGHADKFDLLLSTDVLAEGFNLQQCRNIVNYDLPWNPMRLVQRHGRVDRIGSPHTQVFLRTFFPDDELDELLKLEARVRRKLAQAAASVGVEVSPIAGGAEGQQSFSETREEIEKLAKNDASIYERGGTESAAQTGEEYRQELRKALLRRGDEIRQLPWKAGSGMAKGKQRGHFFCAQVGKRSYLRFVPFEHGALISEVGTCLRLIECDEDMSRVMPDDLRQTAFASWQRARQDIFDSWTYETDPANLQPKVPKLNREIAEHLRRYPAPNFEKSRLTRALEAVEAPCSLREQKLLRVVFENRCSSQGAKSRALVEEIERIGLEPFRAPEPLPPITKDDVHLICWMAVSVDSLRNR